jgi:riboflavin kinase / FMN adenylyltransferase
MKVWHGLESYPPSVPECAVCIGRFDGVHVGHKALICGAVDEARKHGWPSVVFTFDRHPAELFAPDRAPEYLTTLDQKVELIRALGPDHLLIAHFDERFRDLSPEAFLHFVVSGMLRARAVFVGEDFRFGYQHAGDVDYLRDGSSRFHFDTRVIPAVQVGGEKAASRRIRELLHEGSLETANRMLGHPYRIAGTVARGAQLGRKLGYPTANLQLAARQAVPKDGIYAVRAVIEGRKLPGACSIGLRPTVGGTDRTIETYLIDFEGDLYGQAMEVEFVKWLRDEEKFDSLETLVEQIAEDVEQAKAAL